jgi:uncharacterized membrane protein YqjE
VESTPDQRPVSALTKDLVRSTVALLRGELLLARLELQTAVKNAGRHAGLSGAGAALLWLGLHCLLACAIIGLGILFEGRYWLGALVVGALLVIGGGAALYVGSRRLRDDAELPSLRDSLREDRALLNQKAYEIREATRFRRAA